MNTSEQHKATRGSCLLDLFLRPVVGLLRQLTVGESTGSPSALFVGSGFRGHLVGNTRIISVLSDAK